VNLAEIKNSLDLLASKFILAETAYLSSLEWNDWTNAIIGLKELSLTLTYPAAKRSEVILSQTLKRSF
jgi:hypothetical protein